MAESAALQTPFIKRQTMRPQDHLEFFEKRNAPMMFFLPFDVTTNLRNLRLAHRERAITLLPRDARRPLNVREIQPDEFALISPISFETALSWRSFARM